MTNKKQLKLQCESKAFGFWREDLRRQLQVEFYQGQAAFIYKYEESHLCDVVHILHLLKSWILTHRILSSVIYFLIVTSLWPSDPLIKFKYFWDGQHFQITPSFFRSVSHEWNLKAAKFIYCKLTHAKMCDSDRNIPLFSQGVILLWVVWLFIRKLLYVSQPGMSVNWPHLAFTCTWLAFQT